MFRPVREAIFIELQPEGPTETSYVEHYFDQCTRLYVCMELEKDALEWYRTYAKVKGDLSVAFAHDVSQCNTVSRLSKYAAIFERGMRKDLIELKQLKANRSKRDVLCKALVQSTAAPQEDPGCSCTPAQARTGAERETGKTSPEYLPPSDWLQRVVLSDEDPGKLQTHVQRLFAEWRPKTATKAILVELLAVTYWRLARASRLEAQLFEQYKFYQGVEGNLLTAFVQDASELDCFGKLGQYETRLRHSLSKIIKDLLN